MSKVAIVTGAGQGIGFAIAKRLVEDGFKVGILDYNAETAEKAVAELSEDKAFSVVADVSKQAEVAAAFQKVVDHFGDLNVVINRSGRQNGRSDYMRKIRIKHILKGRDGMTLVEVLAAFAILLIGIAFLYKSTVMSLNQIRKAREVQEQADRAVSEFYEKKAEESSEKQTVVLTVKKQDSDTAVSQWGMEVKVGEAKSSDGYFIYFFGQEGSEK